MDVHDLTAAYALDALEPADAERYEEHLGQCEECRAQLAELNEAAGALAFGAVAPAPPAHLRESILSAATAERSNVIPLRPRRWTPRVLAVAAAAACVAVGFGISSLTSSGRQVISAALVISPHHTATLHVDGLGAAPQGKTYEAWVILPGGSAPRPAGLFAGRDVALDGAVPPHAVVAVTVEPSGGSAAPTTTPVVSART